MRDLLDIHGVSPERLVLEVTESVMMAATSSTRSSLQVFKDLGLQVAIDDFGTGYSSLAYLHTLPVSAVKIDRSFIERLRAVDDSTPVVKAIIDMAHALGLRAVAEGVSDEKLQQIVSSLGCDMAQGFLWTRPLPASEFSRWWRAGVGSTEDAKHDGGDLALRLAYGCSGRSEWPPRCAYRTVPATNPSSTASSTDRGVRQSPMATTSTSSAARSRTNASTGTCPCAKTRPDTSSMTTGSLVSTCFR